MIRRKITPHEACARIQQLCVRGERCSFDMRRKIIGWGISPAEADKIIDSLIDNRFIDDTRYAHSFVRDKYRFQHWGRRRIVMELRVRRIPMSVISEALGEIIEDDYEAFAAEAVAARFRSLGEQALTFEGRQKIFRHTVSKGYEPELVISIIKRLIRNAE